MPNREGLERIHAVDLFCGIGGLTHGLGLSGIRVRAGFDVDQSCRYAYETNNRGSVFVTSDIRDIRFRDIAPYYKGAEIRVLVGCAPCQPFSAHMRGMRKPRVEEDCSMVEEFGRLIREGKPDIVSMENVPGLKKHEAFNELLSILDKTGYVSDYGIVSCANFGVPQKRKRLVLLASRLGKIFLPCATGKRTTVGDYIQHLPQIRDGETSGKDQMHVSAVLSEKNRQRIRQSKPDGSWEDWDEKIRNKCHSGTAHYPGPYGRMSWDALSPTITTQFCYYSTGRFGHPEQDRAISIREGALLQTFPEEYDFVKKGKPFAIREVARHIGNAVPVELGRAIGKSIVEATNV